MIEKIKKFLLGKNKPLVEMLISIEKIEKRMVLLRNGRLEEFQLERAREINISGSIFKGRVKNIEPGLKAMFVDIGLEKNAFLHYWDALPAAIDEIETIQRSSSGEKKAHTKKITADDIPTLYPPGSEVVIQVTKGPIGTKGPRVTTNISLPGRFVVLTPFSDQFGISRRISDPAERKRLRKMLEKIHVPDGMGVIIRTAGEGQKARYLIRDVAFLLEQWNEIEKAIKEKPAPCVVHHESGLVHKAVRDFLTDEVDRIIVDDPDAFEQLKLHIANISKRSVKKVRLYTEQIPLFEKFGVEKQIEEAFSREVQLRSGAHLVIDETEALVAIDVNTGKSRAGREDGSDSILPTNLEAAEEIARQLRLRNIGGLIILDFIDMRSKKDQNAVYQKLKECLARDKAKTHVLPISPLGLIEMTRQRTEESVARTAYMDCPHCRGRGVIKTPETLSLEIQRTISRVARQNPNIHEYRLIVSPILLDRLRRMDEDSLIELERRLAIRLAFRSDPNLHPEQYKILDAATDTELKP
jgi:ribonuclease G